MPLSSRSPILTAWTSATILILAGAGFVTPWRLGDELWTRFNRLF